MCCELVDVTSTCWVFEPVAVVGAAVEEVVVLVAFVLLLVDELTIVWGVLLLELSMLVVKTADEADVVDPGRVELNCRIVVVDKEVEVVIDGLLWL